MSIHKDDEPNVNVPVFVDKIRDLLVISAHFATITLRFAEELIKSTIKSPAAHETENHQCIGNYIKAMCFKSMSLTGRQAIALEIHKILLDFRDASTETGHPDIY